jgi:hypothetical protein
MSCNSEFIARGTAAALFSQVAFVESGRLIACTKLFVRQDVTCQATVRYNVISQRNHRLGLADSASYWSVDEPIGDLALTETHREFRNGCWTMAV